MNFIRRFEKLTKAEMSIADFYNLDVEYLFRQSVLKPKLPDFLKDE